MSDQAEEYKTAYERELTARKALESELEEKTRELESSFNRLHNQQRLLVQNEKLATLGTLSAGVAHEINNPMAFVYANMENLHNYLPALTGLFERLKRSTEIDDAQREAFAKEVESFIEDEDLEFVFEELPDLIDDTREGINRVRDIVLNLRSFARTNSNERVDFDVVNGLESTLKLLRNELKAIVVLDLHLERVPLISANPGEINQVFLNLLVNARQALESVENAKVSVSTSYDADNVYIDISDNGVGIAPESMEHLFEPFFTTKPEGKGTGMGLSIAYGIVTDHGGSISVDSEPGKGTHFRIRLPQVDDL